MTSPAWIVCERRTHWAAALRTAIARTHPCSHFGPVHEARSLRELSARLDYFSDAIILCEVTQGTLDDSLAWIADTGWRKPTFRTVALLEYSFEFRADCEKARLASISTSAHAALREAGAAEVICSPRRLQSILLLGQRPALGGAHHTAYHFDPDPSLESWALSLLPWPGAEPAITKSES